MKQEIINELNNKKILILGFGREGRSTYSFIKQNVKYSLLAIADQNDISESAELLKQGVVLHMGKDYLVNMNDYDIIIKTPGISLRGYEYINEKITSQTDLVIKYGRDKVIGITGTKGKSTTSSLTYWILKQAGKKVRLIGNIGIPAFEILYEEQNIEYFVYELSAHQLEYLHASPYIAVVLNIFEEHLDHFGTLDRYKKAKLNIFKYQKAGDYSISNKEIIEETKDSKSTKLVVSQNGKLQKNYTIMNKDIVKSNINDKILIVEFPNDTKIIGTHNMYNSMVAITIAHILNIDNNVIQEALKTFETLPHRLQDIGVYDGVKYIDDSISTIPEATIKAIETISDVQTVVIGGMDRGINYDILVDYINSNININYILMYESGKRIYDMTRHTENVIYVKDLKEAVKKCKEITYKGKACVLSPAAASYGHFKNFEERGEMFKRYILT